MADLKISEKDGCVLVDVQVTPRASRSAVVGMFETRLKVLLDAPPVDGAANEALIALFSKLLKVKKRDVVIVRGETSRQKTVAITGTTIERVKKLAPPSDP